MSKALLIKSQVDKNGGEVGKWNNFNNAPSYIQGIHTGKMLEDISAEKLGALISGIPTPWARAKLFKFAFATITSPDPNINTEGLMQFYNMLHSEWRGLMAVIALYPDRIRFSDPVKMDVRGDDCNIASAFGRMLFNDKDIWSNQDELAKNPDTQPFIQLIYYRDHLVGGTSPLTGCFTGVDYSKLGNDASDINWYRQGKFEDPMNFLTPEEVQKLYLFVKNMNRNQQAFEQKINSQRDGNPKMDLNGFKAVSRQWEDELRRKGQGKLREVGPVAQYGNLSVPFSDLYRSDVPVYMKPDFTFTYTNDGDYKVIGDIQELLSKDNYVVGWFEDANEITKLSSSPVYYLRVPDLSDNSNSYFSLPLSEQGIDIFKNSLSSLLGYSSTAANTKLSAKINDAGQLAVTLVVEIDGEAVTLNKREYEIRWMTSNGRVILWPNFVSENWNRYYLYSEFTSDANESFTPFFKYEGNILRNIRGEFLTTDYESTPEEDKQVEVKKLVTYPHGQGTELLKYDIIGTNKPMTGVLVKVKEAGKPCNAGILMFRQDIVKDLTNIDVQSSATVGVDFGSNNTCVYYNAGNRGAQPIQFKNNRTVIVGKENIDTRAIAENNELLFFSNYESNNGQLKSWLHEHDSRYTLQNTAEEIAGGVPVNRPNVLVNNMDEFIIETQAGNLHYNMKWLNDDKGLLKKRAFIKSIWLQACAFLYQNKIRPSQINWSYPGSMMEADVDELERIFEELCRTMPIAGKRPTLNDTHITEAEAVCSFALSNDNFGLNNNNMFLGIDVGGSTSDILLLAKNPTKGNQASLFRESSVRLAAGVFFNTVINSEDFRRALLNFHEGKSTKVHVANIQEIIREQKKAPYYLNSIFDQLKTEDDYDKFYNSIADNAKAIFTLPAYVTGLLLYYSGMLIGKTIKDNNLENISRIDVLSFGKGGRLFHWLRNAASNSTTMGYYKTCLNAGVKRIIDRELEVNYRDEIEIDNKAEVAKGLCNMQDLNKMFADNQSDICGEVGIRFTNSQGASKELLPTDELSGEYFDNDMNYFDFAGMECFEEFFNIFINFVSVKTKLCTADNELRNDLADLPNKVSSFICQDSEYKSAKRKANNGSKFAYHQPLLIAEGACFLEKSLIKKSFQLMKTLSLYIDRWYIAAALSSDNIPRRIELPNREDRIWLYFYEDINNDRIIYGRSYQQHFLDKKVHYKGDIFSKIVRENETFKRFGKDVSLKEIFKAAEIFDHLRKDFPENEDIVTYVSFSVDVTYAAQEVFLDILNDNGFKVKESVARISHLALELSSKKGYLKDAKSILVMVACNENLRYIVYKQANNVFVRQAKEAVLRGHGTDLRGRALLEQIVWQINNSSKFIKKDEEEFEIVRLSQNLERWLLQLDNTKYDRPVLYNDITFSRALHNKQSATIMKSHIEDRTKVIVDDVVDKIIQYVKEKEVISSDISHILFIGDSFKNTMFKDALLQRYAVSNSNIITYQDKDLPEIVSIYNQMDLSQFDSLRADRKSLSAEQLEQIKIAEEERREREKATRRQEEIDQANAAVREAEKKFNAAIQEAENYEKKGDYSGMIDLLNIALTIKPNNTEAKHLLDEANRKLSEVKVKNEQYNKAIRAAQDAFNEQRWQDAYSKSESALELRPDSPEAKRINTESQRNIKLAESVKEFLLRADTFIGQKLYAEAIEELNKAKHADANNKEISLRIEKIETIQNQHKAKIEDLVQQMAIAKSNKDFEKAIEICNSLLDLDSSNQRKWSEHITTLKAEWQKTKIAAELFDNLIKQINSANYNEDWKTVISLCNEALSIKDNENIRNILRKAEAKYQIIVEQKAFEESVSQIKSLIADKVLDKARSLTNELQQKYPEHNDIAKQLFRTIFEAQDSWSEKTKEPEVVKRPPIGFGQYNKSEDKSKFFFEEDFPKKKLNTQRIERTTVEKKTQPKKVNDDFFDMDTSKSDSRKNGSEIKGLSNKDFDF